MIMSTNMTASDLQPFTAMTPTPDLSLLWNSYGHFPVEEGHRKLQQDSPLVIETCDDVPRWFSTRRTDPVALFSTFYDCSCTGNFSTSFEMSCQQRSEQECFEPYIPLADRDQQDETQETYCINRNYQISFYVLNDQETGELEYVPDGENICTAFLKGPGAGHTLCIQSGSSCSYQLKQFHGFYTEDAADVCTSGNLENCRQVLAGLGYDETAISKLCYRRFWDEQECLSPVAGYSEDCGGQVDSNRTEVMFVTPDCSDVDPCAVSRCAIAPYKYTTLGESIQVYPTCSSHTLTPTAAPTDAIMPMPLVSSSIGHVWELFVLASALF